MYEAPQPSDDLSISDHLLTSEPAY